MRPAAIADDCQREACILYISVLAVRGLLADASLLDKSGIGLALLGTGIQLLCCGED